MDLNVARTAALKAARDIVEKARHDDRDLTDTEQGQIATHLEDVKKFDVQIKGRELATAVRNLHTGDDTGDGDDAQAKSLGEHFAKHVGADGLARVKSISGATVSAPEFKAATDPQLTTGAVYAPYLTEFDRSVVQAYRPPPSVASLLGSGTLGSSNAVTYLVEGAVEGAFATVAEGAAKPQLHFADPTTVTDPLRKIAAWWDMSDEMAEDLAFVVSEINQRGMYLLAMTEDAQLINGDGTGTNILGLLNRSGIQTENQAATNDSSGDALFRAITKVQTATGMAADGIMINPVDYQALRLAKDSSGQYYGGGFFGGGGLFQPVWGLHTVVTTSVPAKTAVVGAFRVAATVYRKGGVRVETTNSDQGKFTSNLLTTRIEERIALAVRIPSAVVKTTLK